MSVSLPRKSLYRPYLLPAGVGDRPVPLEVAENLSAVVPNLNAPPVARAVEITDDLPATLPIVTHV